MAWWWQWAPADSEGEALDTIRLPIVDCCPQSLDDAAGRSEGFARAVAAAYETGATVNFRGLFAGEERRRTVIPLYPFQRRSFWVQKRRAR